MSERPSRYSLYRETQPTAAAGWRLETICAPARAFGADGIAVGPDGRVWNAELEGDQVTAWDAERDVLEIVSPIGAAMPGPDDLAFDSAGTAYATEPLGDRVTALTAAGEYRVVLDDAPAANGIAVHPRTDVLYVDEMREEGRLLEVDRSARNRLRVIAEGLDWPNALAVGPDDRLYIPLVMRGEIVAVDPSDGNLETIREGLAAPTAVKVERGRIVVGEAGTGVVSATGLDGGEATVLAEPGLGIDNLCFDAAGTLYVSNFVEARIDRYPAGFASPDRTLAGGGLLGPYSLAAHPSGAILVADAYSLALLDGDGALRRRSRMLVDQHFMAIGAVASGGDTFAVSQAGDLFRLAEDGRDAVKIHSATASVTSQYLAKADSGAVAIAGDGERLFAALAPDGDVVELARDGATVGLRATGLGRIVGLAARGDLLAATDAEAGRLLLVRPDGIDAIDGLAAPQGVAIGIDEVYVAERDARRVVRLGLDGSGLEPLATDLPLGMPAPGGDAGRRCSLLAAEDGSVAIGCDGDGSVRRLTRAT